MAPPDPAPPLAADLADWLALSESRPFAEAVEEAARQSLSSGRPRTAAPAGSGVSSTCGLAPSFPYAARPRTA